MSEISINIFEIEKNLKNNVMTYLISLGKFSESKDVGVEGIFNLVTDMELMLFCCKSLNNI